MSIIPIQQSFKQKVVTKNVEGKEQTKSEDVKKTVYSHTSWVEEKNMDEIYSLLTSQKYKVRSAGVITGIASLLAFVHVPFLNKLPVLYKAGGILGSSALAYFGAQYIISKSTGRHITKLIGENDLIPFWNKSSNVLQKQNVYFYLNDDKGFRPDILYHGISEKQIDQILPDGVYGNKKISNAQNYKKFVHNKDANQTNGLLQELGFSPRSKREAVHH